MAVGSNPGRWATTPIARRTAGAARTTSWPATEAMPDVGVDSVVRIFTVVVLPAPFGPSRANTSPSATSKETPSRARTLPA